jgi:hypothetical protein
MFVRSDDGLPEAAGNNGRRGEEQRRKRQKSRGRIKKKEQLKKYPTGSGGHCLWIGNQHWIGRIFHGTERRRSMEKVVTGTPCRSAILPRTGLDQHGEVWLRLLLRRTPRLLWYWD